MQMETDGLVLKEQPVGENDRLITILTRSAGLVKAFARGTQKLKSRGLAATQMLSYSDFTIYRGRDAMIIDRTEAKKIFFGLRNHLENLTLAQYFCELALTLAPEQEEAERFLRLLLNALYFLDKGEKPLPIIKAAVEMRLLTFAGYMPNLIACAGCGAYESDPMFFCLEEGNLRCKKCYHPSPLPCVSVNNGVLAALRHTIYAPFEKLFAFDLSESGRRQLEQVAERYLLIRTQRSYKTLQFYHSITAK